VSRLIINIKQRPGIACEARSASVDSLSVDVVLVQRAFVVAAGENRLDGAIGGTGMGERSNAGRFQTCRSVGTSHVQDALGAAQSLYDAITQELFDERGAGRANRLCLFYAPLPIVSEELACIRWQVIQDCAPITAAVRAYVGGSEPVILEYRDGNVGGAHPQGLTHESERRGIQYVIQFDVAAEALARTSPVLLSKMSPRPM